VRVEPAPEYGIGAVARLTGISVDTLRAWERRYAAVVPRRHARVRLYDETDLARLRVLRELTTQGHAIGRLASLSLEALESLRAGGTRTQAAGRPGGSDVGDQAWVALERFDSERLEAELARFAALLPAGTLCTDVVLPLLRRAGAAWEEGRISIAQEHLLSAALRSLLGTVLRTRGHARSRAIVVFATTEGELHELGLLTAALLAGAAGLSPLYLGTSLPAAEVVRAARRSGAHAVVLAAVSEAAGRDPVRAVRDIARRLPRTVELLVGGAKDERLAAALAESAAWVPDLRACAAALERVAARRA
jgi:MerR family transcriptional regulator, light-induced transcriptional regulator